MTNPPPSMPVARSYPHLLAILSIRLGLGLLLVWLARSVLLRLPFTRGLALPEVPLTPANLITLITYLIALVLLLNYARAVRAVWSQAFPQQTALTPALTGLIYVGALFAGYSALEMPVRIWMGETGGLLLQVIALTLAIIFVTRAAMAGYQHLPLWFASLRWEARSGAPTEVACLQCGRLNPPATKFCGHCGHAFTL